MTAVENTEKPKSIGERMKETRLREKNAADQRRERDRRKLMEKHQIDRIEIVIPIMGDIVARAYPGKWSEIYRERIRKGYASHATGSLTLTEVNEINDKAHDMPLAYGTGKTPDQAFRALIEKLEAPE